MKRKTKAFTLIEAILVAILIGLLAAIGLVNASQSRTQVSNNMGTNIVADVNRGIQRAVIEDQAVEITVTGSETDKEIVRKVMQALANTPYFTNESGSNWEKWLDGHDAAWGGLTTIPAGTVDIRTLELVFYEM